MTTVDATKQASIQRVADYVYNVQEELPAKTTQDEIHELGQNILFGTPLMIGMPFVANMAKKPY